MSAKKVAKGSVYIFISQTVTAIAAVFLVFFLARRLGPSEYGRYSAVYAFCVIIHVLFRSGFTGSISKFVASQNEKTYPLARFGFLSQAIWSVFIFLMIFVFAGFFAERIFNDPSLASCIRISTLHFVPLAFFAMCYAVLVGQREFRRAALLYSTYPLILIFSVLAVLLFWRTAVAAFYAIFIAALLSLIPMRFIAPKIEKKEADIDHGRVIALAVSLIISAAALKAVFQIDKIFIKQIMRTNDTVGVYALASNFSLILQLFAVSLASTLFPSIAASFARGDLDLTRKYLLDGTRFLSRVLLPLSFGLCLVGKDVILLVFGNQYLESRATLAVLIFGSAFFSFFLLYRQLLISLDKHWANVLITVWILALALVLTPLLIWRYGTIGAACSTLVCSMVGAVISGGYVFRLVRMRYPWASFFKIFSGTFACFLIALFASNLGYAIRYGVYAILAVAFMVFLHLVRELTREDWEIVKKMYAKNQ